MNFYNQHNFTDFIKFKPKFNAKSIQVEIISQMHNGNHVINSEIVTENGMKTKYISIYEVKDGLIKV